MLGFFKHSRNLNHQHLFFIAGAEMTNIMHKPTAVGKEAPGLSSGEGNNTSPRQGQLESGF